MCRPFSRAACLAPTGEDGSSSDTRAASRASRPTASRPRGSAKQLTNRQAMTTSPVRSWARLNAVTHTHTHTHTHTNAHKQSSKDTAYL